MIVLFLMQTHASFPLERSHLLDVFTTRALFLSLNVLVILLDRRVVGAHRFR